MRLAELQRATRSYLLEGGTPPSTLCEAVGAPAVERWRVYADAYRIRLVGVLADTYPVLSRTLGDDWHPIALGFVLARPSTHRSARDYGGELAAFLAEDGADPALRRLGELAAFEWALAGAFDAPESATLAVSDLAGLPPEHWERLGLAFVPSLRRLSLTTDAVATWRTASGGTAGDDDRAGGEWLVWRADLEPRFRRLEDDEADALDRCRAGGTFGELCAALDARHGDAAAALAAQWLRRWIDDGLVAAAGPG